MSSKYTQTEHVTKAAPPQIPITCPFTDKEITQAWEKCAHTVQEHSDQIVQRWKEEIDMFLVFAGLFSAVLTAFNVQSYALLQEDNADTAAKALVQISAQLRSMTISGTSIASDKDPFMPNSFTAPSSAIWINTLWFSSLICTLSASSIAIMVKQWLQQYNLGLSGTSHEVARLRQYRYESLLKWRIVWIIAMLPILLQVALCLFLAGLVLLMWTLHPVPAAIASFLVGTLLVFIIATTILPAFQSDCFYKSPAALGWILILQTVRRILRLKGHNHFRNWHSREKAQVRVKRADLDRRLATKTYCISLDEVALRTAVIPCMWDLPPERLTPFLEDILRTTTRWEPVVPCILHFMTLAARNPETNKKMVKKLLAEAWWPRMEANSEIGELFVRTMATLVSRGLEANYAFYRAIQSLSYSALDGGIRLSPELVECLVSIIPSPKTGREYAALIRSQDPRGSPLVFSYFEVLPMLIRYLARLVIDSPHDKERVELQIDAMLDTLQGFLVHVAWTEDLSNLGTILLALRSSGHIAQMVSLKTDAKCSPLVPPDIVEAYQDVLKYIGAAVTGKAFQAQFKRRLEILKLQPTMLGSRDPLRLVGMLQDDLDVLAKLFWMLPWQHNGQRRRPNNSTASGPNSPPLSSSPRLFIPPRPPPTSINSSTSVPGSATTAVDQTQPDKEKDGGGLATLLTGTWTPSAPPSARTNPSRNPSPRPSPNRSPMPSPEPSPRLGAGASGNLLSDKSEHQTSASVQPEVTRTIPPVPISIQAQEEEEEENNLNTPDGSTLENSLPTATPSSSSSRRARMKAKLRLLRPTSYTAVAPSSGFGSDNNDVELHTIVPTIDTLQLGPDALEPLSIPSPSSFAFSFTLESEHINSPLTPPRAHARRRVGSNGADLGSDSESSRLLGGDSERRRSSSISHAA